MAELTKGKRAPAGRYFRIDGLRWASGTGVQYTVHITVRARARVVVVVVVVVVVGSHLPT